MEGRGGRDGSNPPPNTVSTTRRVKTHRERLYCDDKEGKKEFGPDLRTDGGKRGRLESFGN